MDRGLVYPGQIPLDTDVLNAQKDAYYGLGWLAEALIGTGTAVVGLGVSPTAPASLQVSVEPGAIFNLQTVDSAAYGSLGTDANQIVKQGVAPATQLLTLTPPTTTGFSTNYLVQVAFSEVDGSPVVLPYYNAANPAVAWSGPNNSGTAQNTSRQDKCVVGLKAGTPAATGSQTTPSPDAGYTGLFVVTVANGQTAITSGNIVRLASAPYFPAVPSIPADVQTSTWTYAVAGGTANALTASLSPVPAANVAGLVARVKITASNTGVPTLDAGAGALPIKTMKGNDLLAGDLPLGAIVTFICNGTEWLLGGISAGDVSGRLLNTQTFTSSGTYTPTAGTKAIRVTVVGAGGAGGGCVALSSGQFKAAGGGGSGGWARSWLTSGFSSVPVTIGAGGLGVAGQSGGQGGTTSFGSLISITGGNGGDVGTAFSIPSMQAGGSGGITTGGNLFLSNGDPGNYGVSFSGANMVSGSGGASILGAGGDPIPPSTSDGNSAGGPGGGGSGAAAIGPSVANKGGSGAPGVVIVEEFA